MCYELLDFFVCIVEILVQVFVVFVLQMLLKRGFECDLLNLFDLVVGFCFARLILNTFAVVVAEWWQWWWRCHVWHACSEIHLRILTHFIHMRSKPRAINKLCFSTAE